MNNEDILWNMLKDELGQTGAAAVIANFYAESALDPANLQNSYERKLGMNDGQYTSALNSDTYSKDEFVHDGAGYGLAQWTHWSRKAALYNYIKARNGKMDDLKLQCEFALMELNDYGLVGALKTAGLRDAVAIVLRRYEKPADQSESNVDRRYKLAGEILARHTVGVSSVKERLSRVMKELNDIIDEL